MADDTNAGAETGTKWTRITTERGDAWKCAECCYVEQQTEEPTGSCGVCAAAERDAPTRDPEAEFRERRRLRKEQQAAEARRRRRRRLGLDRTR